MLVWHAAELQFATLLLWTIQTILLFLEQLVPKAL
jgi:hypothetical protein